MTIQHAAILGTLIYMALLVGMLRASRRLSNRRNKRLSRLRSEVLPAPWDGAVRRTPRYYWAAWTRDIGRALRE